MSFALVGSEYVEVLGANTLSVSPTTIGNWLIVGAFGSTGNPMFLVGGGGVTTWTQIEGQDGAAFSSGMWIGQITSTGPSVITFSTTFLYIGQMAQEFSVSGIASFVTGGQLDAPNPSSSGNFPSLTADSGEMYVGFSEIVFPGTLSTSTPGYTDTPTYSGAGGSNLWAVFDTNVSGVQAPDWSSTSASQGGCLVSVLLKGGGMRLAMAP